MNQQQQNKIDAAVLNVFSTCKVRSLPFSCQELLSFYGYSCIPYNSLSPEKQLACTTISDDAFCLNHTVYYNSNTAPFRIRFSLMHELGHICLRHTSVSGKSQSPEQEANAFASLILAPRMVIHYSGCRTAEDLSRVFQMTFEASGYALNDYYRWYDHILRDKMSPLDKAMYLHFYDSEKKRFVWNRTICPDCQSELINHSSCRYPECARIEKEQKALDARMIASQYSYRDWETWLPEGFERAEYRYLYGDMY